MPDPAIALYLSGNTGRRIGTLFSDEAGRSADPEHKRMFMAMKREVLRLGGYATAVLRPEPDRRMRGGWTASERQIGEAAFRLVSSVGAGRAGHPVLAIDGFQVASGVGMPR